jgi:hypothetical protein
VNDPETLHDESSLKNINICIYALLREIELNEELL